MDTARAIERFLNSPALGEGTRKSYRHDVDEFAAWLGDRRLELATSVSKLRALLTDVLDA